MQVIKDKKVAIRFDDQIYQTSPVFITSDEYWDGGMNEESTLREKASFYRLTAKMSDIVKAVILSLGEEPMIGKAFCEHGSMYANWSDIKSYKLFRIMAKTIQKNLYYTLSLPEDSSVIDMVVESNFRYFSYIALYLPRSQVVICPSCHTEILVYAHNTANIVPILQKTIEQYSDVNHKIFLRMVDGVL